MLLQSPDGAIEEFFPLSELGRGDDHMWDNGGRDRNEEGVICV